MEYEVPGRPGTISRRQFLRSTAKALATVPLLAIPLLESCRKPETVPQGVPPFTGSDADLIEDLSHRAFQFFWDQAHPSTGLIKDRTHARDSDTYYAASIAAVGFGLTALCIGDSRGYEPSNQIRTRVRTTLSSLLNLAEKHEGFFYHFLNWATGQRVWRSELSSMDTAILICGVLTARQYFSSDRSIVDLATKIYNDVNWPWMLNGGTTLSLGWRPESGSSRRAGRTTAS